MTQRYISGTCFVGLFSMVLASCAQQVAAPARGVPGNGEANGEGTAGGEETSGASTTDTSGSKTTASAGSCDEQWTKFVAYFSKGKKLEYTGTVVALAQTMPISHTEEVLESSDASVSRRVVLTSSDTIASQIISQIKIPDPVVLKKESFLSGCNSGGGKAPGVLVYGGDSAKISGVKNESIALKSGKKDAQYSQISGSVPINGKASQANIKLWSSLSTPGLVLKQVSELSGVPVVTNAVITEELSSAE